MVIESEKRFKKALDLLEKSAKKQHGAESKNVQALEEQNKILQQGLDALKQDYEKMDAVFVALKAEIKVAQQEAQQKANEGGAANADVAALTGERDALKEELVMTRTDYQSLEDSFSTLKRQYAEVEEEGQEFYANASNESAGVVSEKEFESLSDERDSLKEELEKIKENYVMQLAENELLIAEANGVEKTKESLKASLDKSIQKLEQLSIN
ncbi:MAG: hypothetical protein KAR62_05610 [Sphingomonadales bacterium]|nr:hypothetical protein [Sphingomonadales bacterium]